MQFAAGFAHGVSPPESRYVVYRGFTGYEGKGERREMVCIGQKHRAF